PAVVVRVPGRLPALAVAPCSSPDLARTTVATERPGRCTPPGLFAFRGAGTPPTMEEETTMRNDLQQTWRRLKRRLGSRSRAARARYEAVSALCAALADASRSAELRGCLC